MQASCRVNTVSPLPKNHEIRAVWRQDAGPGEAWQCPRCEYAATLGCNAAYHALQTDHGVPLLRPRPPERPLQPPVLPGVRVGDAMQLSDDVHLALEIARAALLLARASHAHPASLEPLQDLYDRLRRADDARRDPAVVG